AAQGTDRSFDFGDIASEAVSSVEIYKTGIATIPTGGIGSTINVKTTRPLEAPGLKMSFGAAGVYDTSSTRLRDNTWTGESSGIIFRRHLIPCHIFGDHIPGIGILDRHRHGAGGPDLVALHVDGVDTSPTKKCDQILPGRITPHTRDDHASITEARGMARHVTRRSARPPLIRKHVPQRLPDGYDRLGHQRPLAAWRRRSITGQPRPTTTRSRRSR
ncbi:MAG: hypothetical protein P8Y10_16040, partial [Gemmatimonadales bacterium]